MATNYLYQPPKNYMSATIYNRLATGNVSKARFELFQHVPVIGSRCMMLVTVADENVRTLATDGKFLAFNPDYVSGLNFRELCGAIYNAVFHVVKLDHLRRNHGRERDFALWNMASDIVINLAISYHGKYPLPEGAIIDHAYAGMSTETVYAILEKEQERNAKSQSKPEPKPAETGDDDQSSAKGSGGEGEDNEPDDGTDGGDEGPHDNDGEGEKDNDDNRSDDDPSNGSDDDHNSDDQEPPPPDDAGPSDSDGDANQPEPTPNSLTTTYDASGDGDGTGGPGKPTPLTGEEFQERAEQEIRDIIAMASLDMKRMAKNFGEMPNDIQRLVEQIRVPEIEWREAVRDWAKDAVSSSTAWFPPDRRFIMNGDYFPGRQGKDKLGTVVFVIDTSASMGRGELFCCKKALQDVIDELEPTRLVVICCDASINTIDDFEPEAMTTFEPRLIGGGGTSFVPPFAYVNDHVDDCVGLIYATDMVARDPFDVVRVPDYPVLWLDTDGGKWEKSPRYGVRVKVSLDDIALANANL